MSESNTLAAKLELMIQKAARSLAAARRLIDTSDYDLDVRFEEVSSCPNKTQDQKMSEGFERLLNEFKAEIEEE